MAKLLSEIAADHIAAANCKQKYAEDFYRVVASFSAYLHHDATTDDLQEETVNRWIDGLHLEPGGRFRRRTLVILWNHAVQAGLAQWHGRLRHVQPLGSWTLDELRQRAASPDGVTVREFLERYLRAAHGYGDGHMIELVRFVEKWRKRPLRISEFSTEVSDSFRKFVYRAKNRKKRPYSEHTRAKCVNEFRLMWKLAEELGLAGQSGLRSTPTKRVRYGFTIPADEWQEQPLTRDEITPATSLPCVVINCLFKWNFRIQSDKTRNYYRQGVRDFAGYLNRVPVVADLTDDNVAAFLAWLRDDRKINNVSVNDRRKIIVAIWGFLFKLGQLKHLPLIPKLPEPEPVPCAWTADQLRTLFFACGDQRGLINGAPAGIWWQSLVSALWDSGERIGAFMLLRWDHVDLDERWIHVPASIRKGGKKSRSYRLSVSTCNLLRQLKKASTANEFVWNRKGHHSTYFYGFARILKRAGLPYDRRSKFHRIRRSVSSHLEAIGVNSSEMLGHDERATTVKSYIDRTIARERQVVDVLGSIANAQPSPQQPSQQQVDASAAIQLISQLAQQVSHLTAALTEKQAN